MKYPRPWTAVGEDRVMGTVEGTRSLNQHEFLLTRKRVIQRRKGQGFLRLLYHPLLHLVERPWLPC